MAEGLAGERVAVMEPSSLQPEVWAELNFGAAQLGDARSTRRLVGSAAIIAPRLLRTRQLLRERPGVVLVLQDWTELDYTQYHSVSI